MQVKSLWLLGFFALSAALPVAAAERYVIQYNGSRKPLEAILSSHGARIVADYAAIRVMAVSAKTPGLENALAGQAGIGFVAKDRKVKWAPSPAASWSEPVLAVAGARPTGADFPAPMGAKFLTRQWNLYAIQANLAWGVAQSARPVNVAVVDTGICAHHVDLEGKVDPAFSKSFVPVEDECPATQAPACIDCPEWEDRYFHGTHVASLITTNSAGSAGVAPNVRLRAIKVANCRGEGNWSALLAGLIYAADTGNEVINISLGSMFRDDDPEAALLIQALRSAIAYAEGAGSLVVTSSGNDGKNLDRRDGTVSMPCQAGGLCVGATTRSDAVAQFSNRGLEAPQMVAPGGGTPVAPLPGEMENLYLIGSCSRHSVLYPGCNSASAILFVNGTSQSAPQVAGAAALIDGMLPSLPEDLKRRLMDNADDLGPSGKDNKFGNGRLNVYRALQ